MTQHEMRKIALQALYLANQSDENNYEEVCSNAMNALDLKTFPDYSKKLLEGVLKNKASLDESISKFLKKGWKLDRLDSIDRAVLELGLFEMKNSDAIEPVAALNEALNLADEFSSAKSKSFINGVLANFIDER